MCTSSLRAERCGAVGVWVLVLALGFWLNGRGWLLWCGRPYENVDEVPCDEGSRGYGMGGGSLWSRCLCVGLGLPGVGSYQGLSSCLSCSRLYFQRLLFGIGLGSSTKLQSKPGQAHKKARFMKTSP